LDGVGLSRNAGGLQSRKRLACANEPNAFWCGCIGGSGREEHSLIGEDVKRAFQQDSARPEKHDRMILRSDEVPESIGGEQHSPFCAPAVEVNPPPYNDADENRSEWFGRHEVLCFSARLI
jgi:hypothetical protein